MIWKKTKCNVLIVQDMLVTQRNLSDLRSSSRARSNLELGSVATLSSFDLLKNWEVKELRLTQEESDCVLKLNEYGVVECSSPYLWSLRYDTVNDVPISLFDDDLSLVKSADLASVAFDGQYTSLGNLPLLSEHHPIILANDLCDANLNNLQSKSLSRRNLGLHSISSYNTNGNAVLDNVVLDSLKINSLKNEFHEGTYHPLIMSNQVMSRANELDTLANIDNFGMVKITTELSLDRSDMVYTNAYHYHVMNEIETEIYNLDRGVLTGMDEMLVDLKKRNDLLVAGRNLVEVNKNLARSYLGLNTISKLNIQDGDNVDLSTQDGASELDIIVEQLYLRHMAIKGVYNVDKHNVPVLPNIVGSRPANQYRRNYPLIIKNNILSNLSLDYFPIAQNFIDTETPNYGRIKINDLIITNDISWSKHRSDTINSTWYDPESMAISYLTMLIHGSNLLTQMDSHTLQVYIDDINEEDISTLYPKNENLFGYNHTMFDISTVLELAPIAKSKSYRDLTIKPSSLEQFTNDADFISVKKTLSDLHDIEKARQSLELGSVSLMNNIFDGSIQGNRIELTDIILNKSFIFESNIINVLDISQDERENSAFLIRRPEGEIEWGVLPIYSSLEVSRAACVMLMDYDISNIAIERYKACTTGTLVQFVEYMEKNIRRLIERVRKLDVKGKYSERLNFILNESPRFIKNDAYKRILEKSTFVPTKVVFENTPRTVIQKYDM